MVGQSPSSGRRWAPAVPALLLAAALLSIPLAASASAVPSVPPATQSDIIINPMVAAENVTWNGVNVSSHDQPSSALSIPGSQTAAVNFSFQESAIGYVTNVTLQLTYLGIVLTTARTSPTAAESGAHADVPSLVSARATLNWTFGPLAQALEGVYQLQAGLTNRTGATLWSETFFVFVKSPYLVECGAVIVLLILLVAELYWGVAAVRSARKPARPPVSSWDGAKGGPPPSSGAPPPSAGPSSPPTSGDGSPGNAPPGSAGGGGSS